MFCANSEVERRAAQAQALAVLSAIVKILFHPSPGQSVPLLTPPPYPGPRMPTFSSLAPPDAAACEMFCSCLILSLKSDTHWITVMPAGTV